MRRVLVLLKLASIVVLSIVVGAALYFGSTETYFYLTRSDAKALALAQQVFRRVCVEQALDPDSFRGPIRPNPEEDARAAQYNYEWLRAPGEAISVGITYLPHDYGYSISQALTERRRDSSR